MRNEPFFAKQVTPVLEFLIREGSEHDKSLAWTVSSFMDRREKVSSFITKTLNRYAIKPGKIFGRNTKDDKYKVIRLIADDVVIQNVQSRKVEVRNINELLKEWSAANYRELNFIDEIIGTIKSVLGPYLGAFLTAALVSWLIAQINRE